MKDELTDAEWERAWDAFDRNGASEMEPVIESIVAVHGAETLRKAADEAMNAPWGWIHGIDVATRVLFRHWLSDLADEYDPAPGNDDGGRG